MISKCANPACSTPFHYMRDGRLFRMETAPQPAGLEPLDFREPKFARHIEHYWLCGKCATSLTLVMHEGRVVAVPQGRARAAAS